MVHILKIPKVDIIWINKLMSAKALMAELTQFKTDVNQESLNQKTTQYIIGTCEYDLFGASTAFYSSCMYSI